jgi:hypothetical protein
MTATHRQVCFRHHGEACRVCDRSDNVVVHHRDGDATNDSPENLVPLCQSCHKHVHNGNRRDETMSALIDALERTPAPKFDPADFDGVPSGASVTVKETYEGYKYYYWQWRDGDTIRSRYIEPADDPAPKRQDDGSQTALDDWVTV